MVLFFGLQVFQRVLRAYATKLLMKLPKGGMGIVAAATGMDGHIKVYIIQLTGFNLMTYVAFLLLLLVC